MIEKRIGLFKSNSYRYLNGGDVIRETKSVKLFFRNFVDCSIRTPVSSTIYVSVESTIVLVLLSIVER